jgi:hypothetical protein
VSDEPFGLPGIPLVNATRARDIARAYKALAENLEDARALAEARRAERQSNWWMTYSIALAQMPPDAGDGA